VAREEARCARPGNLLHWSRGVRARADEGFYAPFFRQYYYYAINGVTDDEGWWLSSTDQPASLELSLPGEARIGRVVLYTDNLKDYDLRLQAADGSAQVTEVRGNAERVRSHDFAAPVPAAKVTVTALASVTGPGTRDARVREIEAYADTGSGPAAPLRPAD
jgi:hypothetical protein